MLGNITTLKNSQESYDEAKYEGVSIKISSWQLFCVRCKEGSSSEERPFQIGLSKAEERGRHFIQITMNSNKESQLKWVMVRLSRLKEREIYKSKLSMENADFERQSTHTIHHHYHHDPSIYMFFVQSSTKHASVLEILLQIACIGMNPGPGKFATNGSHETSKIGPLYSAVLSDTTLKTQRRPFLTNCCQPQQALRTHKTPLTQTLSIKSTGRRHRTTSKDRAQLQEILNFMPYTLLRCRNQS